MNIIMAVIGLVGLKRAPECIKMHHFEGETPQTTFLDTGLITDFINFDCEIDYYQTSAVQF